jgi:hypothetical protein
VAKTVVTQIMFRRFEVTTGKNPDRSGAFNGLAFLRALLWCRITAFPCAMVVPASAGLGLGVAEYVGKVADATDETLNSIG